MKLSRKHRIDPFRLLAISGTLASALGLLFNLIINANFRRSIIPYPQIIVPSINCLAVIGGIILICKPRLFRLLYTLLFVQSLHLVFTGFETIGIFLYAFLHLLLFCNGFYKSHFKAKVSVSLGFWLLVLLSLFPYAWSRVFFAVGISFYIFCSYFCVYNLLQDKLSYLLPNIVVREKKPTLTLPELGRILNLHELGLTERQIGCITACLQGYESYKEIGDRYFVSESAIKKEMSFLFNMFGVDNREMLRLTLLQYEISN
jgi:DNA-binding CsgD family transcriptional regulator